MCGIFGYLNKKNRPAEPGPLEKAVAAMAHRGPDGTGRELLGAVGLAHRRLAIIDLSPAGAQPMSTPDGRLTIVYNGEVYNFGEHRRALIKAGVEFTSETDTEVILRLYEREGPACLTKLNGMFALAVHDKRDGSLFLARDRLGIKPLYYADGDERLVFGSEIRAMLRSGLVRPRLSKEGLNSYLALGAVQEPLTIIDGIRMLPPGHWALVQDGRMKVESFWQLPSGQETGPVRDRAELVGELGELLADAVRMRLLGDVPVGAFLSGGLDSTSIVSLMARAEGPAPRTVSVVFPQKELSEAPFSRLAARAYGTEHQEMDLTPGRIAELMPAALAAMDQPTNDGVNTYVVSRETRRAGLTVALSGLGGDELFGGYRTFRLAPALARLKPLLPGPLGSLAGGLTGLLLKKTDRALKLGRWFAGQGLEGNAYFHARELFGPRARAELCPLLEPADLVPPEPYRESLGGDLFNRVSVLEVSHYMRHMLLRDADVMSMAHGLEVRVPLLDHRVVELLLSLPGAFKARGRPPKPLLAEAVGDLPPEIVERTKMGFALPYGHWLRTTLRERVETALLADDGFYDPAAAGRLWSRFLAGKSHWARPWALYVLKDWSRRQGLV